MPTGEKIDLYKKHRSEYVTPRRLRTILRHPVRKRG